MDRPARLDAFVMQLSAAIRRRLSAGREQRGNRPTSRRGLLLAVGSAILASCATGPKQNDFTVASGRGVVTGSITYESSIGEYSLVVVPSTYGSAPLLSVGYSMWPPLGPLYDEGLKARGSTFAVALPAGDYKIIGWRVRQGYKISNSARRMDVGFTVEAGKASYLGNLHFNPEWEVSLRDQAQRDLPVLEARYPFMKTTPWAYQIATGTDLKGFGGDYAWSIQPPPMLFIPVKR